MGARPSYEVARLAEGWAWLEAVRDAGRVVRRLAERRDAIRAGAAWRSPSFDVVVRHGRGDGMGRADAVMSFEGRHRAELEDAGRAIGEFNDVYEDALGWPAPMPRAAECARSRYVFDEDVHTTAERLGVSERTVLRLTREFAVLASRELGL